MGVDDGGKPVLAACDAEKILCANADTTNPGRSTQCLLSFWSSISPEAMSVTVPSKKCRPVVTIS